MLEDDDLCSIVWIAFYVQLLILSSMLMARLLNEVGGAALLALVLLCCAIRVFRNLPLLLVLLPFD